MPLLSIVPKVPHGHLQVSLLCSPSFVWVSLSSCPRSPQLCKVNPLCPVLCFGCFAYSPLCLTFVLTVLAINNEDYLYTILERTKDSKMFFRICSSNAEVQGVSTLHHSYQRDECRKQGLEIFNFLSLGHIVLNLNLCLCFQSSCPSCCVMLCLMYSMINF